MLITNITHLAFGVPDECRQAERFELENDMREWAKDCTTSWITFTKTTVSATTWKEEK